MSNKMVIVMLAEMVLMTEENFNGFVQEISGANLGEEMKNFMQTAIDAANKKRQSLTA